MNNNRFLGCVLTATLLHMGCSSGGNGNAQGSCTNIAGQWTVTMVTDLSKCAGTAVTTTAAAAVTQTGCSFTMTGGGLTITGGVSGNQISGNLSFPQGTATISGAFSGTTSNDGNSASGSAPWTYSGGTTTCSGSTQITATRVSSDDAGTA